MCSVDLVRRSVRCFVFFYLILNLKSKTNLDWSGAAHWQHWCGEKHIPTGICLLMLFSVSIWSSNARLKISMLLVFWASPKQHKTVNSRNTFTSTFLQGFMVYNRDIELINFFFLLFCLCVYRSSLGCTCSSSEPAQPPATHLHPAATLLQPQRDCTVTNHWSNPIHPDTSTPTTPSHDRPLPADVTVNPAATLYGTEHAQPASVPLCSAHGRTVCPH